MTATIDIEKKNHVARLTINNPPANTWTEDSLKQLENIYQRLLSIDLDIKSGGMPGDVAFQTLIADLTP